MGHSETFEHTADLGLRVVGRDLSELFETAAAGLFDVIVANRTEVRDHEQESVALVSDSTEDLLLAWLNELIYRCETRHRFYCRFDGRGGRERPKPPCHDRRRTDRPRSACPGP